MQTICLPKRWFELETPVKSRDWELPQVGPLIYFFRNKMLPISFPEI